MLVSVFRRGLVQQLRHALPSLGTTPASRQLATTPQNTPAAEDDESYELLPPGCSLKDPTYGRSFSGKHTSMSDPEIYDRKPVEEYSPLKKRAQMPSQPLNVAAAQAKLQERKDAKKQISEEEDDLYVYLPPGSSMRDPVSLPNSMSDPLERKVYYRDPAAAPTQQ